MPLLELLWVSDYISYPNTGQDKRFVFQKGKAPRKFRQSTQESDKFISPTHIRLYPQVTTLSLICVRFCVDPRAAMRLERISKYSQ